MTRTPVRRVLYSSAAVAASCLLTSRATAKVTRIIPRGQPSPYPPAPLDTSKATLVSAASESALGVKNGVVRIEAGDWAFADGNEIAGIKSPLLR